MTVLPPLLSGPGPGNRLVVSLVGVKPSPGVDTALHVAAGETIVGRESLSRDDTIAVGGPSKGWEREGRREGEK